MVKKGFMDALLEKCLFWRKDTRSHWFVKVGRCLGIKTKKEGPVPERGEFDSDLKVLISRAI